MAKPITPSTFQGNVITWGNYSAVILGTLINNIRGVKINDKQQIDGVHAAGDLIVGFGSGNVDLSGSVSILLDTVFDLIAVAPEGRLSYIPFFDIIHSFVTINGIHTITYKNVVFTEFNLDLNQGDTSITIEIPIMASNIIYS